MTRLDEFLLNRVSGISSLRKFIERFSTRSDGALVKETGKAPLRLFLARFTYLREAAAPSDRGMLPARLLPASIRVWRPGSTPISSGMIPERPLPDRSSRTSEVRFAMQPCCSLPWSCTDLRSTDTTRTGRLELQLTPRQLQKLSESVLHDPRTPCGSAEMPDLKQSRAWRSASDLLPGCAEENVESFDRKMKMLHRRSVCAWRGDGDLE